MNYSENLVINKHNFVNVVQLLKPIANYCYDKE